MRTTNQRQSLEGRRPMTDTRPRNRALFVLASIAAVVLAAGRTRAGQRSDVALRLAPTSTLGVTIGNSSSTVHVTKNSIVSFQNNMPGCVVSPHQPSCSIVLGLFLAKLETFTIVSSAGSFTVTNPSIGIAGPLTLVDTGYGFSIPTGTTATSAGTLTGTFADGTPVSPQTFQGTAPLSSALAVQLSLSPQSLVASGTLPFTLTVQGHTVQGSVALAAQGQVPFLNVPPVARAGGDQSVVCAGGRLTRVTLNGSQSTDPDNNIVSFTWLLNGAVIAQGVTATVSLPLGVSVVTLQVRDALGGMGVDTTDVNVELGNDPNCCPLGYNVIVGTSNNDTLVGTEGR
jgi:hypothetical protein